MILNLLNDSKVPLFEKFKIIALYAIRLPLLSNLEYNRYENDPSVKKLVNIL